LVFIPKKKAQRKKVIVMKYEDEEGEKVRKNLGGW
jgi:5S rRNA maturation endonuclease (ribonuclease M5)